MTFHTITNAPLGRYDLEFRNARRGSFVGLLTVAILLSGAAWLWRTGEMPGCFFAAVSGFLALFGLLAASLLRKSFGPENWLLRASPHGLMIKFRSYLNDHFHDHDRVVVLIPRSEIESVTPVRERVVRPGSDSGSVEAANCRYLDVHFKPGVDTTELERLLSEERTREAPKGRFGRVRHLAYPARLVDDGRTLRLTWRDKQTAITPGLNRAVELLRPSLPVTEERRLTTDLATPSPDRAEAESQILDLAARGDTFAAIKLARKTYGYSLAEARDFVEGLTRDAAKP